MQSVIFIIIYFFHRYFHLKESIQTKQSSMKLQKMHENYVCFEEKDKQKNIFFLLAFFMNLPHQLMEQAINIIYYQTNKMSHKSPQRCNLSPYNSSKGNYWSSNRKSSPFGISGVSMCTRELSRSPFRSPSRTQRSFCSTTPKKSHQVQILYDRTSQYNIPPTSQTSKKCSGIFTQLIKTHNLQQKNPKISTTNHKNTKINQNLYCFHGNQHKKEEQNGGSYGKYHNCYGKISFSMFKEQNRSMVKKNQVSENVNVFQSFGSPSHCNMKEDNVYFISDFVTEQPFIQNDPHLTQQPQKEQQNVLISSFEQAITLIRKASQKTEPFPSDSMIDDNVQMSIEKGKFGQSFNMDPFM